MGDLILITGAAGYLGGAVARAALARGHAVRAVVRSGTAPDGVETVRNDLADLPAAAFEGVASVIHCAASLSGDAAAQARDTVAATDRLTGLAARARVARMVLAGSMAVYSGALPPGSTVTEDSPLEPFPEGRDAYLRARLAQEAAARAHRGAMGLWILRLGAVWGPGRLWNAHLGIPLGPVLIRIGAGGEVPLVHVDHAALAMVLAAETAPDGVEVLNILDDDRPDRRSYVAALRRGGGWPRIVLPLPLGLFGAAARLGLPGPGLLRGPTLAARMRPLRYANAAARARLGWQPRHGFAEAMETAKGTPA